MQAGKKGVFMKIFSKFVLVAALGFSLTGISSNCVEAAAQKKMPMAMKYTKLNGGQKNAVWSMALELLKYNIGLESRFDAKKLVESMVGLSSD